MAEIAAQDGDPWRLPLERARGKIGDDVGANAGARAFGANDHAAAAAPGARR